MPRHDSWGRWLSGDSRRHSCIAAAIGNDSLLRARTSHCIAAATSLPLEQRAELAHALLLSLEPDDGDADADEAWAVKIRRRLRAIREGTAVLRDWDEALADIQRSLASQGSKRR
ncbi:MAG: hypothetical protein DCC68_26090 [Planctomycetota bacterium]|nr:MAG: hypothetical protein DCC68_26090 [Planctomycetota bacterium]